MLRIGIGAPPDREVPSLIEVSDVDELLAHTYYTSRAAYCSTWGVRCRREDKEMAG